MAIETIEHYTPDGNLGSLYNDPALLGKTVGEMLVDSDRPGFVYLEDLPTGDRMPAQEITDYIGQVATSIGTLSGQALCSRQPDNVVKRVGLPAEIYHSDVASTTGVEDVVGYWGIAPNVNIGSDNQLGVVRLLPVDAVWQYMRHVPRQRLWTALDCRVHYGGDITSVKEPLPPIHESDGTMLVSYQDVYPTDASNLTEMLGWIQQAATQAERFDAVCRPQSISLAAGRAVFFANRFVLHSWMPGAAHIEAPDAAGSGIVRAGIVADSGFSRAVRYQAR